MRRRTGFVHELTLFYPDCTILLVIDTKDRIAFHSEALRLKDQLVFWASMLTFSVSRDSRSTFTIGAIASKADGRISMLSLR